MKKLDKNIYLLSMEDKDVFCLEPIQQRLKNIFRNVYNIEMRPSENLELFSMTKGQ